MSTKQKTKHIIQDGTACALCGEEKELKLSHIASKLLAKRKPWPKEVLVKEKGVVALYKGDGSRVVEADIEKYYLLCGDCEQSCSTNERLFALDFVETNGEGSYGAWFQPFCVAQLWRVLRCRWHHAKPPSELEYPTSKNTNNFAIWSEIELGGPDAETRYEADVESAEAAWRNFLSDGVSLPAAHQPYFYQLAENPGIAGWDNDLYLATKFISPNLIVLHVQVWDLVFVGVIRDTKGVFPSLMTPYLVRDNGTFPPHSKGLKVLRRNNPYFNWVRKHYREKDLRQRENVLVGTVDAKGNFLRDARFGPGAS